MKKAIKKYNNSINISNGFNDTQNYIKYVVFSSQGSSIRTLYSFMHYFFNIFIDDIDFSESRYFELYIDNETEQINVRYLKGDNKIKMNTTYKIFKNIVEKNIWNNTKIYEFCFPNENENKKTKYDINMVGASIMIILSVLDGVLFVLLILYCYKKS